MAIGLYPVKAVLGGILALGALAAAYAAWDDARFAYLRVSSIPAAQAARPDDAFVIGKIVDRKLQSQQAAPISDADAAAAHAALIRAPLSRSVLRIVGLKSEMAGQKRRADLALDLSDKVSRRDALTQLWLIERSVQKDDMGAAIRHYHAAMSAHPELQSALLPILAKALAFPEVREAVAPYVARQARWSKSLLNVAIIQDNPADVARLMIPIGDMVRGEAYEKINARLISRLAEMGDFSMALKLVHVVVSKSNPAKLATLAINDTTTDHRLGMLAWNLAEEGRILATANDHGGFDIDADPLTRGIAASRIVPVIGGRIYTFGQTLRAGSDVSDTSTTFDWQAFCVPAQVGGPVWQQLLPKQRATQRYESIISVPTSCKGLKFVLFVRGPEGQQAGHGSFEALAFKTRTN